MLLTHSAPFPLCSLFCSRSTTGVFSSVSFRSPYQSPQSRRAHLTNNCWSEGTLEHIVAARRSTIMGRCRSTRYARLFPPPESTSEGEHIHHLPNANSSKSPSLLPYTSIFIPMAKCLVAWCGKTPWVLLARAPILALNLRLLCHGSRSSTVRLDLPLRPMNRFPNVWRGA